MHKLLFVLTSALLISGTALAQTDDEWLSWPMGDRFTISAQAFFPKIDTKVRVDASNGAPGTTIDFEQNLNLSDSETLPALGFAWRFAKKHQLIASVFDLSRSGSAITTTEIRFGDETFQIDLPIASFFDVRVTSVGYAYSFIFDEKKELALSAGLSVQDIKFGLVGTTNLGLIEEESGLTVKTVMLIAYNAKLNYFKFAIVMVFCKWNGIRKSGTIVVGIRDGSAGKYI